MADKLYYIGSVGPLIHDDVDFPEAFNSEAPITHGAPTDPSHSALLSDVSTSIDASFPVGIVITLDSNTDPATILGFGTWSYLGTQTIGTTSIYYFSRTA